MGSALRQRSTVNVRDGAAKTARGWNLPHFNFTGYRIYDTGFLDQQITTSDSSEHVSARPFNTSLGPRIFAHALGLDVMVVPIPGCKARYTIVDGRGGLKSQVPSNRSQICIGFLDIAGLHRLKDAFRLFA